MRIKYCFNLIVFILFAAIDMHLTSCSGGTDQENIVKILNDSRSGLTEPFTADTVIVKNDTVRVQVCVDTDNKSLTEALQNINSSCSNVLAKVKMNAGKNDSINEKRYDFSLTSPNCLFSISYNNFAAVEIAGYLHDKGDKSDKVIVSDLFCNKDKSSLSSIQLPRSNYHKIMELLDKDYSKEEINAMLASAVKVENSLRIKNLMLPQKKDEFTTLYDIKINDDSYDFYFSISQEVSGMIDESIMDQIGRNVSSSVSDDFNKLSNPDKIKSDLEILDKKVIYHYSVSRHSDESYRLVFKFPKLNNYILEKEELM